METYIFQGAFASSCWSYQEAVLPPGGTDTCTLRGEDCRYCGAFHSISENFVLDD